MDQLQKQLVDLQQSYSKLEMDHSELRIRLDEANHALTSERTGKLIQERELNELKEQLRALLQGGTSLREIHAYRGRSTILARGVDAFATIGREYLGDYCWTHPSASSTPNPGQGQADDPAVARPAVKIEEDDTSVLRVSLLEVCHLAF
ncbi:hypothetical protein FRB95_009966 [Tulasnella sp. JGI-2019a]|nr:hypothetical protein FRB95_009966 [Tulasnella sp. JGI-2019a]